MPANRSVEALNVIEHVSPCLIPCLVCFAGCLFGLQGREEAFYRGILFQTFPDRLIEQVAPLSDDNDTGVMIANVSKQITVIKT